MAGYLRIVNIKGNPDYAAEPHETFIRIDRDSGSVLGNPHPLSKKSDVKQRKEVIRLFETDLKADLVRKGPMSREIDLLAQRVADGENIVGGCHCHPSPCHGDVVAKVVMARAAQIQAEQVTHSAAPGQS